jgi:hypothetical protein
MLNKYLLTIAITFSSTIAFAVVEDEVLYQQNNKAWVAEKVSQHSVWEKPACVAHVETSDGESSLEVVAYYNEDSDSFLEPEVNVITTFDVSFLDVTAKVNGTSKVYTMIPVLPQDGSLVGARALFGDREELVSSIRKLNSVKVRYIDTQGEVKSLSFSLSGSSKAIQTQFEQCTLEFKALPESLPLVDELN